MTRSFRDPVLKRLYEGLRATPPVVFNGTVGKAYAQGWNAPDVKVPPLVARGTQQWAAWAAGVDNARDARKAGTWTRAYPKTYLVDRGTRA